LSACAVGLLCAAAVPPPQAEPLVPRVQATLESPFGRASYRVADLGGDGDDELVLVGRDGRVAVYDHPAEGAEPLVALPGGSLELADPLETLIALAPLSGGPGIELVELGPRGLAARGFGPRDPEELHGWREPVQLSRTARLRLRVGAPTFADFVRDVNRDGRLDVVVPAGEQCELWLQGTGEGPTAEGQPGPGVVLRRAATIAVELERWGNRDPSALSFTLESSFSIPDVQTRDLNGDRRPDLLVTQGEQRAFHLQAADGSYPERASVVLDLGIFRDTARTDGLKLGQPLSIEAGATFEIRDLDGDRIPDYVIAHGRKVWVFLGSGAGPQFHQPASILRSAEDVTALSVLELDSGAAAPAPDLLLVKVQVPTVAVLVRALVSEWDIQISAAGYRNAGKGTFETLPAWKSSLKLRLPSIVRILRDPAAIVRQLETVESRFRGATAADLDGDGARDLVFIAEDGARLDLWLGRGAPQGIDAEEKLRELLFGEAERVYDLDRAMQWLASVADQRTAAQTGGRPPDASARLRAGARLSAVEVGDFSGTGRQLLALGYEDPSDGRLSIDLVGL
jgi:hypothetical protein